MPINARLNRAERIGSAALGVGLVALAAFGIDAVWLRVVSLVFGGVFIIGGVGGT